MAFGLDREDLARRARTWSPLAGIAWALVSGEIGQWRRRGRSPVLWWRDDDARRPSAGLDRLIALACAHRMAVALAVIPDVDLAGLAARIAGEPLVHTIQHGCDHIDRNREGGFSSEFSPGAPEREVAEAVNLGWARLSAATAASPIYAPPWNVLTPNVGAALRRTSLQAVSLYGAPPFPGETLPQINAHIDVMRWRPARFRGEVNLVNRFWRHLRARRLGGLFDEPIGLLTHHRNLDEDAWRFLGTFLDRLSAPGLGLVWRTPTELLAATGARSAD